MTPFASFSKICIQPSDFRDVSKRWCQSGSSSLWLEWSTILCQSNAGRSTIPWNIWCRGSAMRNSDGSKNQDKWLPLRLPSSAARGQSKRSGVRFTKGGYVVGSSEYPSVLSDFIQSPSVIISCPCDDDSSLFCPSRNMTAIAKCRIGMQMQMHNAIPKCNSMHCGALIPFQFWS
jgi:hypothetical protein